MKIFRARGERNYARSWLFRMLGALLFIAIITIMGLFVIEYINEHYVGWLVWSGIDLMTVFLGGAIAIMASLAVLLRFEALYDTLSDENRERKQTEKPIW
jgi:hypothetical protein